MSEQKVTLEMQLDEATELRDCIADIVCWCRGFSAGRPQGEDGPIMSSVDAISHANARLKAAINRAQRAQEMPA